MLCVFLLISTSWAAATPVVFVHGNGDNAQTWDDVITSYRAAGYVPENLTAITYLSEEQQASPRGNLHTQEQSELVARALEAVGPRVDVVAHSLGVTTALHAIESFGLWPRIRKFVGIAGALRGLSSCLAASPWFPNPPTCLGQDPWDPDRFGFHPFFNPLMATNGFRAMPKSAPSTSFYVIHAGADDEITCSTGWGCDTSLFEPAPNVLEQVQVEGGHFGARSRTAALQLRMLAR